MNKHRVILANGVEATRNAAHRVYTHATVVTGCPDGQEGVLSWHMTKAAADKYLRSSQALATAAYHQGTLRQVEVELLPAKTRKASSANVAEPVVEAPVEEVQEPVVEAPAEPVQEAQEAPVEAMPADSQDVAEEAQEEAPEAAPAVKKQTTRMLKVECSEGSGYKVRLARSWLDSFGAPSCPCHSLVMVGE